jgi:hypothetical protein
MLTRREALKVAALSLVAPSQVLVGVALLEVDPLGDCVDGNPWAVEVRHCSYCSTCAYAHLRGADGERPLRMYRSLDADSLIVCERCVDLHLRGEESEAAT